MQWWSNMHIFKSSNFVQVSTSYTNFGMNCSVKITIGALLTICTIVHTYVWPGFDKPKVKQSMNCVPRSHFLSYQDTYDKHLVTGVCAHPALRSHELL